MTSTDSGRTDRRNCIVWLLNKPVLECDPTIKENSHYDYKIYAANKFIDTVNSWKMEKLDLCEYKMVKIWALYSYQAAYEAVRWQNDSKERQITAYLMHLNSSRSFLSSLQ